MKSTYHTIYLSSHLDDVALSCGGQVFLQAEAHEEVLIATVAAGEPRVEVRSVFAEFLHHNWGVSAKEALNVRRAEDKRACQVLGADWFHWSLPDCIYRVHPETGEPLYTSDEEIFGPIHPSEDYLVTEISQWMASLPAARRIVAPLTVGNHVDHQLTRLAAERTFGKELFYYEDYPYIQRIPAALEALVDPSCWEREIIPLSEAAITARLEATLEYRSQISSLFSHAQRMTELQREFIEKMGGERIWQQVS